MNAPDPVVYLNDFAKPEELGRVAVLNRFELEAFQSLSMEDLLLAQTISGHGNVWGVWNTPNEICPSKLKAYLASIDISRRLGTYLAKTLALETAPEVVLKLVEEGILVLTRISLLIRLAPTSSTGRSKCHRLKPSTFANRLYAYWIPIVAKALERKVIQPESPGLLSCLTELDTQVLRKNRLARNELERLRTLSARGYWADLPPQQNAAQITDTRGQKQEAGPEIIPREFQPLADRYLEEFGPRNLWIIRDLGPHLLPLLEDLATYLESVDWSTRSRKQITPILRKFIEEHLKIHPWTDSSGSPLKPPFPLMTGARGLDQFQFPPRSWEDLKSLSGTLQSAHLFLTLLAAAGRSGEVENLTRACVTIERDGQDYIRGWTYKLSGNLFGDARTWPAPKILVQLLGQQVRLANVWIRLPSRKVVVAPSKVPPSHDALWLSIGSSATCDASMPLRQVTSVLQKLAERIGMDPKPGGINLHPHRLRKTIGRLAGIALFNSPIALKQLFGHKSIEMTLHYILCDKDIQTEAEAVLRELRVIHCAETLEEMHDAIVSGSPLPAHTGAAASKLADAVKEHETRLASAGRVWREGSAYDLAYLLTARGKGWRFVQKNIICAKAPGEAGLCLKNRGEPNISNCKSGCENRIVLSLARRDMDEVVQVYIDTAKKALEEEQFEVFCYVVGQLLKEVENFPDLNNKYLASSQLQPLLAMYKELGH